MNNLISRLLQYNSISSVLHQKQPDILPTFITIIHTYSISFHLS